MVRLGQGRLSGSVPSGGLCTDLQQWIQAPACLGSPGLLPPLSFCLPRGPEPWGHPTPPSTRQRDSLTDHHHLWVEGLVRPLEIPSLKPARIFSSRCSGRGRAALCSQSRRPVHSTKDPPREVCRSLRNRNLPRSNIPWPLGAELTVGWSPLDVL